MVSRPFKGTFSPIGDTSPSVPSQIVSGNIRIIEYQILCWTHLDGMGDLQLQVKESMGVTRHVGILRCVAANGNQVTFAGDGDATRELVRTGAASNPQGIAIAKKDFPVMLEGWPFRIRED
jgi:hypothetical protein